MQGSKAILKVEIRLIIFNALFCSQQKLLPHCVYKLGILYTSVVPSQEQHHLCQAKCSEVFLCCRSVMQGWYLE